MLQSSTQSSSPSRRRIGTLKFVRTADGKGYMRRQTDNLLQKAKATVTGKKKKKRFFRGANYRFDGSSVKKVKRAVKKATSSKAPSEAGSCDAEVTIKDPATMKLEEADVLSYLGIQKRKECEDGELESESAILIEEIKGRSPTTPKAKKSFRPTLSPSAAIISER